MAEIKKVVQRVYQFDFSKCTLIDGNEMISTEHGNEFEFLDLINFTPIDVELNVVDNIDDYSFNTLDEFTNISKMI